MDKQELKEKKIDLSFYKPNTLGYYGVLLATICELVYLIVILGKMDKTLLIGIFIIINIVFLLFLFSTSMEVKVYKKNASIFTIAFGVYNITRLFVVPNILNVSLNLTITMIILAMSCFAIIAGVISYKKIEDQEKYKKEGKISFTQMSK